MDLERQIEAAIFDFNLNGMPAKRTAKRVMALIKNRDKSPQAGSEAVSAGFALLGGKMTDEELVAVFEAEGMMITMGAQYSVKGQIAQLLNGLKRLGIVAT